jgi:hypothetical protein
MISESIQSLQVSDKIFCSSIKKKGIPQLDMISTNVCNNKVTTQVQSSRFTVRKIKYCRIINLKYLVSL